MLQYTPKIAEQVERAVKHLHESPETSLEEYETTAYIRKQMDDLGIEEVDLGLKVGYVGILRGGEPGPLIGLRAELDGIRQRENPEHRVCSKREGLMHACGHDIHMGALLGAAMMLAGMRQELRGSVAFIFQPGEETLQGARLLVEAGLFQKLRMDAMFGLHNQPAIPLGLCGIRQGELMSAKDDFRVTVKGVGGHSGVPHRTIDPIVAAAAMVNALQTIVSRNVDPLESAVVSVCSIHAGTADNLVVSEAVMTGSIRTLSPEIREIVLERFGTIVSSMATAYGCTAEISLQEVVPMVVNGREMTALAREAAALALGEENMVPAKRTLCSEDFAVYAQYTDTFFYFLGSGTAEGPNPPWHDGDFRADSRAAAYGARLLAESALTAMRRLAAQR